MKSFALNQPSSTNIIFQLGKGRADSSGFMYYRIGSIMLNFRLTAQECFDGNLDRCCGYRPIFKAARDVAANPEAMITTSKVGMIGMS